MALVKLQVLFLYYLNSFLYFIAILKKNKNILKNDMGYTTIIL